MYTAENDRVYGSLHGPYTAVYMGRVHGPYTVVYTAV